MSDVDYASLPVWFAILVTVALIVWAHRERTEP
jgi:hypothetical protein